MQNIARTHKRISTAKGLQDAGLLPESMDIEEANAITAQYALGISPQILAAMDINNLNDPLARQFIPGVQEQRTLPQEEHDPIGDNAYSPIKGIVHRYPDRVLLKATAICAVYCRYCFRREKVGKGDKPLTAAEIQAALSYIRANPDIREVILTGGDPFVLSVRQLEPIMRALQDIPHLDIIRVHTRVPISDPARINDKICALLTSTNKALYIVLHVNHAQEINAPVLDCIQKLHASGANLLSQSVLLKGVNDNTDTLESLFRLLLKHNVKPYYLHHPDLARGTSHFRLPLARGMQIHQSLLGRLSGLAQPAYMLDIPGGAGKIPLNASYVEDLGSGRYSITDYQGEAHIYEDRLDENA